MKLTVLGRYGPYPAPGGACSGYLLENAAGDGRVLLDCGNGTLSRFLELLPLEDLDAVVLSHLHPDHTSDLMVLRYAVQWDLARGRRHRPLPVFSLQEPIEEFQRLPYRDAFSIRGYVPGEEITLAGMTFRFIRTRHAIPCCAVAVEDGGKRLVYSGDTGDCQGVELLAQDADLFLCEANLLQRDNGDNPAGHLTAGEAAALAGRAGVGRLLLTHLFPGYDPGDVLAEARAQGKGRIELAEEGRTYTL